MPQWGKKIDSPTWGGAGPGRGSQMESLGTPSRSFPLSLIHLEKVIVLFVIASKLRRRMLMASLSHANLA